MRFSPPTLSQRLGGEERRQRGDGELMIRQHTAALAIVLATLFSGAAEAGILLFEKVISVNRNPNIFDASQFDLDLGFADSLAIPTNEVKLFDDLMITTADVGNTFDATAANDPGFSQAAQRITDGLNERVKVMLTEDQVNGVSEKRGWYENSFFGHLSSQLPPDLLGAQVNRVSLHIDQFVIGSSTPSSGPTALSAQPLTEGQQFDLVFTLQIYAVPEPVTVLLLVAGLAGMGRFCVRFRAN